MMNTDDERLNQLGEMERCYSTQLCKPSCKPSSSSFFSTLCCTFEEYTS